MKPIRFSNHAREQMRYRGATEQEVIEAISSAVWEPAELGRWECRKEFAYGKEWNGKFYALKQVRPIFVEEQDAIVVITVYVYYY
jgi:hypothetical protein